MLRVYLSGPPQADRADPWVRYASDGNPAARGRDVPARWPPDAHLEAILAADRVRLVPLALPPMPRNRVRAAVRYALEDQLAAVGDEAAIAIADAGSGAVVAAIASDDLIRAVASCDRRIARIIPEAALAPIDDGWTWCASAAGGGFIRRADSGTFPVDGEPGGTADLPGEIAVALAQAARSSDIPAAIHVAFRCDTARLARWSEASGVPFVAAPEWDWTGATPAAFAAAPDFLANDGRNDAAARSSRLARAFRPALVLAALALIVHVGALAAQRAWLGIENWRLSRALIEEAAAAQLPDAATASAAAAAIARRNAELRHRVAQDAPADALPLLARAAPALGALPPGALRSARYTDGAWTLELGKVEADALSRMTRALSVAGLDAVAAPTAAGMRMRLSLAATAR